MTERELLDDGQDVVFSHQQIFDVVNFDSLACVAAEQDNIALVQLAFRTGAVIQQFATANCGDGATGRRFCPEVIVGSLNQALIDSPQPRYGCASAPPLGSHSDGRGSYPLPAHPGCGRHAAL